MSKAIKFTNNTYLDSSSICHNKTKLSDILDKKIIELFKGSSNGSSISLNDSIENYDFILVTLRGGLYTRGTTLIPVLQINYGTGDTTPWSVIAYQNNTVYGSIKLNFSNSKTLSVTYYNSSWGKPTIENVLGIKL